MPVVSFLSTADFSVSVLMGSCHSSPGSQCPPRVNKPHGDHCPHGGNNPHGAGHCPQGSNTPHGDVVLVLMEAILLMAVNVLTAAAMPLMVFILLIAVTVIMMSTVNMVVNVLKTATVVTELGTIFKNDTVNLGVTGLHRPHRGVTVTRRPPPVSAVMKL